jgi:hypothetical protein
VDPRFEAEREPEPFAVALAGGDSVAEPANALASTALISAIPGAAPEAIALAVKQHVSFLRSAPIRQPGL